MPPFPVTKNKTTMNEDLYRYLKFYTFLLLFIVLGFLILYEGRVLWIPLGFAVLISFMLFPVCNRIEKVVGHVGAILAGVFLLLLFGFLLFQLIANSISLLNREFVQSRDKILQLGNKILELLANLFDVDIEQRKKLMETLYENLLLDMFPLIKQTIFFSANTLMMFLIIPIFVALILYYRERLVQFILAVVPDKHTEGFKTTIRELGTTYYRFARGMALVYLSVGVLNSIGFLAMGLPNAIYFGVLASLLTFFPYVGIMIGGSAAIIVAWTTYESIWVPLGVVGVLGVVQYLEANLIFPILVGHQLRINPLVTFIAIIVGGIVWGGAGMILFVPFAAILKILSDQLEDLRSLGILLGEGESGPPSHPWKFWKK